MTVANGHVKKDGVTIKSNYRLVSVLSTLPKLFERAKFDQLYHAFTPLFSDNMSGFLRGHSCFTALVKLSDDWRAAWDKKEIIGVVAIDLSKAFDSVCYNLLFAKLKAYGVRQGALGLIQSYLSDSFQRVRCNGSYSNWLPVPCGLLKGSSLGPLLLTFSLTILISVLLPPHYVYTLMTLNNYSTSARWI